MDLLKNQRYAERVDGIYQDLETLLLQNIARHIRDWDKPIDTDIWLLQKLAEIGRLNQENIKLIAEMAGLRQAAVEQMLNEAASEAIESIDRGLQGLARRNLAGDIVPATQSRNVKQVMDSFQAQAKDKLNLCNTTMLYKAQDAYKGLAGDIARTAWEILNSGASGVVTGVESRQQAVRRCIRSLNEKGIPAFVDKAGREWTPEAYVNMVMRNTARHAADEAQMARCQEAGVHLIQITSHSGARPKCAKDQGKIFDLNNGSGYTEDLYGKKIRYYPWSSSSYGEPDGILGINCGHRPWPFIPGVDIQRYFPTEDMEENNKLYKETQVQRALERDIRGQKRLCMLYDEVGDTEAFEEAAAKLKAKEAKLKAYVGQHKHLHRRKDREQVVGFDKRMSAEAIAANKRKYQKFVKSVGEKNAPTFTEYSDPGYTKSDKFKELKSLAKYRESVPDADLYHLRLNETLHQKKLIRGKVVPAIRKPAYILKDASSQKEPEHIMNRMLERNITDDQVQEYVDTALFSVLHYNDTRLAYYSEKGVTVLTKTQDYDDIEWIAKTVWSNNDFDEKTDMIIKEAKRND